MGFLRGTIEGSLGLLPSLQIIQSPLRMRGRQGPEGHNCLPRAGDIALLAQGLVLPPLPWRVSRKPVSEPWAEQSGAGRGQESGHPSLLQAALPACGKTSKQGLWELA